MRTHSSRTHKSKEHRVPFAIKETNYYDPYNLQENKQQNTYDFQNAKETSLASKFLQRWERTNIEQISKKPKIHQDEEENSFEIPQNSIDSQNSMESFKLNSFSENENSVDISDDFPHEIILSRNPSDESADLILKNINILINKVHEICDTK